MKTGIPKTKPEGDIMCSLSEEYDSLCIHNQDGMLLFDRSTVPDSIYQYRCKHIDMG